MWRADPVAIRLCCCCCGGAHPRGRGIASTVADATTTHATCLRCRPSFPLQRLQQLGVDACCMGYALPPCACQPLTTATSRLLLSDPHCRILLLPAMPSTQGALQAVFGKEKHWAPDVHVFPRPLSYHDQCGCRWAAGLRGGLPMMREPSGFCLPCLPYVMQFCSS